MANYKVSGLFTGYYKSSSKAPWWVIPVLVVAVLFNSAILVLAVWLVVSATVAIAAGVASFWVIFKLVVGILLLVGTFGGNK
jgi:hypothetical protein